MKKYIIYIAILALGLILGYVFFGSSTDNLENTKNVSDMSENSATQNQMWTCSMHPQIMQPEPGDCPICGMDLIPAETGADGLAMNEIKMSENAMALANIQTTIVGNVSGTDDNTMQLSGKIMANEEANAVQASYFEGRIEKLNVNFTGRRSSQRAIVGNYLCTHTCCCTTGAFNSSIYEGIPTCLIQGGSQ